MENLYIITGISGHLGRNIAYKLLKENKKVRGLVLHNDKKLFLGKFPNNDNLEIVHGNILNSGDVDKLFLDTLDKKVFLIHTAGLISIQRKMNQKVYDVNVTGTKIITDAAIKHKVHKYIYVSSTDSVKQKKKKYLKDIAYYDEKEVKGCYAKTKAISSKYVLNTCKNKIDACVILPTGMIGPNDYQLGHINEMIIQYLKGDITMLVRGGYDIVDVRDVANGIIAALEVGKANNSYILSNNHFSISEILNIVSELTGQKRIKSFVPKWLVVPFIGVVRLYFKLRGRRLLFTAYSMKTLKKKTYISHEKADYELGYKTRDIKESIKETLEFLKQEYL